MPEFLKNQDLSHWADLAVQYGVKLGIAVLILLIGFWVAARLANFGRRAMLRANLDDTLTSFLRNVLYGVLIALVVVAALQKIGVPSASLIAALGAAGLAIGLALQGSLSNLAWGVLLIGTRPFRVGDFVEVGGMTGTVEQVGLMQTWIVMTDNREVCLPNQMVGSDAIINYNKRGTRRFEVKLSLNYDDDIGAVKAIMLEKMGADPRVLEDPAPGVWTTDLAANCVTLVVRGWTRSGDHWDTQTDFVRITKESLAEAGVDMVIPQHEVVLEKTVDGAGA